MEDTMKPQRSIFLATLALLFAAAVHADDKTPVAKIAGPSEAKPYTLVKLGLDSSSRGTGFAWLTFSKGLSGGSCNGAKEFWFTGPPGEYQVALIVTAEGQIATDQKVITITGDGPGPEPKPDPPKPDPTPPQPAKLYVVIIETTASAVAARGQMLTNQELAKRMSDKGHRWRVVDQFVTDQNGQPPDDVARYIAKAKTKTLPQLFLVDEHGNPRFEGDLPRTPAELLALIQKVGG
jgi:hypothetical protein